MKRKIKTPSPCSKCTYLNKGDVFCQLLDRPVNYDGDILHYEYCKPILRSE